MNQIEKKVLEKITPTEEYREELKKNLKDFRIELKKEIKKRKLPVEIMLVGSIAKDTYLMNNMDIDFFLCFPTSLSKEKIAKNTLSIGKEILSNTEESYAEHPYLRGYYNNYYFELVPCYKIEKASQKLSAVDRTPLHTEFVRNNLKEGEKKEVRLFKQFLKGINCYGAEAQIQGFSGYLCEIIIIYYNSFEQVIKNASKWKKQIKLSLTKKDFLDFKTPLIFIDPVDPERNVASALSEEKFKLFVKACDEYNKKPKINFFFPNPVKPWPNEKIREETRKQECSYIGLKFKKPDIIDENLYPQIRKAERSIEKSCEKKDFSIYDTKFYLDEENSEIYIIIKVQRGKLSETKTHRGPPLKLQRNVKEFNKKWKDNKRLKKGPFKKDNRINVEIKREYIDIKNYLEKNIDELSLGKHLDKIVNKSYQILDQDELFKEKLRVFWTKYLDDKESWER